MGKLGFIIEVPIYNFVCKKTQFINGLKVELTCKLIPMQFIVFHS